MIKASGLNELIKTLTVIKNNLKEDQINKLNKERGKSFKKFMTKNLKNGTIPLEPIKDQSHNPLYDTGRLADQIDVKIVDNSVDVGYFEENTERPEGTELTYTEIAIVQSHGFNTGKVVVPPRPFLDIGFRMYEESGQDEILVNEFIGNVVPI